MQGRHKAGAARRAVLGAVVAALALVAIPASAGAQSSSGGAKCPDPSGTIKLGVSYFGGVGQNVSDLGADSSAIPADQAIINGYNAGAKAFSSAGGIAGCQIQIVPFNFKASSPDFNQTSQQECAAFTQDNKVFAVFGAAYETKVAVDCFAKAKTPFITAGGVYQPTCADLQKYGGYLYVPAGINTCRWGAFIRLWEKAGVFKKGDKVGILIADDGSGQNQTLANKLWTPLLKKAGVTVQTFTFTTATSEATFTNVNSALGNAILQFKSAGVNAVLFTPAGGQTAAAWLPQAKAQDYFPNYGLDSLYGLAIAGALGGDAIKDGQAISLTPGDLPLQAQQALPANSAAQGCASWTMPTTTTIPGASAYCDFLNFVQQGMKGATKLDAATLKKNVAAFKNTFVSSVTYDGATRFFNRRYDGGIKAMMLSFDPTTKTFTSKSNKLVTIP
jgi:hypothetical protein